DLRGLEGLYPRADALEAAILAAAPPALHPSLGIADTRFTAHVAARSVPRGVAQRIEDDQAAAFLATRPAAWLPLDVEAIERLAIFGITTMGTFAALPAHAAEAQFGPAGRLAWLAAHGQDPKLVEPRAFEHERVIEHTQSEPPLVS